MVHTDAGTDKSKSPHSEFDHKHLRTTPNRVFRFWPRGLRGQLVILLLIILILDFAIESTFHYLRFAEEYQEESQSNLEVARAVASNFNSYIDYMLRQEYEIGLALTSLPGDKANDFLMASVKAEPSIQYYRWIDEQGKIMATSMPSASTEVVDRTYFPYIQLISSGHEWAVTDLFSVRIRNVPSFMVLRGIRDEEGYLKGILMAAVSPEKLNTFLSIKRAGQGSIGIVDRQGMLVYRYPDVEMTWEQRDLNNQPDLKSGFPTVRNTETTGTFTSTVDGKRKIIAYAPIASVGWTATASRPEEEAMAVPIRETWDAAGVNFITLCLVSMVAVIIGRGIIVPIRRLGEHARAIGRGNFSQQEEISKPAELKELSIAFNRMAQELQVREDALQQAHAVLEKRVQERTEDLHKANEELQAEIIDRKRAETALVDSEKRYRTLFELASDAFLTVLEPPGGIIEANDAAVRLLGYTQDELRNLTDRDIIAPEVFEESHRHWIAQARDHGYFLSETIWVRKDGSRIDVEVGGKPFELDGQTVYQLIGRDITERKRIEEDLRRAQRLETAGSIAGQVAHDFNNLLSPLIGYPELMKMELPEDHPAIIYCDAMLNAAQQMADINEDLLTLSRRGHFNQEPINLNQVIEQAVGNISPLPANLLVKLNLSTDLLPVSGSTAQLLRVVTNLLSNAREAMQDNGQLTIETDNVYVDKLIGGYSSVDAGEYVRLQVSDTGSGISQEIRQKIFDPFFTTKQTDQRRGSGLGLSVVQVIVEDHHGYVDVSSEVGKGTVFSIFLPVCREETDKGKVAEILGGTEAILVVDDDKAQREVLFQLLRTLGYRVGTAASGEEAIGYIKEHKVDLMILDMIMPGGMDGADTYRETLTISPNLKVIIMSGYAESSRVKEAQSIGAGTFIRKPVTLQRLAQAIRQGLDRKAEPQSSSPSQLGTV